MSTTFGIPLYPVDDKILIDVEGCLQPYICENFFNTVFFRGNGSDSKWLNEWAEGLEGDVRVYPLNNTPQGIYTIKDCKELLKSEK